MLLSTYFFYIIVSLPHGSSVTELPTVEKLFHNQAQFLIVALITLLSDGSASA
jgi:hypothetical protein